MVEFVNGDIFQANTEAIVNAVNCVGVMGKGIAARFKQIYPENFKAYEKKCKAGQLVFGKLFIFETGSLTYPKFIVNFPTKKHWRDKSNVKDIDLGLVVLLDWIIAQNITSIAIPALGCGLGGCDWSIVRQRIKNTFQEFSNVKVIIFEPHFC